MKTLSKTIYIAIFFLIFSIMISCQNTNTGTYYEMIGNLKLNYTIKGKGPVMIVGHINSGKIGYELSLQALEKHFTMVYYEPRGTGMSQAPQTLDGYNQDEMLKEIDALRKYLKVDKIWLFGHSDQSAIALEYALKFPKNTAGLILTGTSLIGTQQETLDRRKKSETRRAKESAWFAKVLQDWDYMIANHSQNDAEGQDISEAPIKWWCYNKESANKVIPIVKQIAKAGRRKPINGIYWTERQSERQKYLDTQKQFPSISTDILIINGTQDTNNPVQYAEDLHKVLPTSKLVFIEQAGHFPWIENPEKTFQAIESWLKTKNKQSSSIIN